MGADYWQGSRIGEADKMALTINTNIGATIAANSLNQLNQEYQKLQEQSTTGKRINKAADDAAGMAILAGMKQESIGNSAAMNNMSRGKDLLSTQEGAMGQIKDIFDRMKSLAVSSADGSISAGDRGKNNQELQDLISEVDRIAGSTKYNGINLLDGTNASLDLQVGAGTNATDKMTVNMYDATVANMNITGGAVDTVANATDFINNLDLDLKDLTSAFSTVGSYTNRLDYATANLMETNKNLEASMSTIEDADMAKVSADLSKNSALQQLGVQSLAKSNQQPFSYLNLMA